MNCWKTLGIEPDADQKAIKLAYSKLLKNTRPDDDPDGFTKLHNAYKTALAFSKQTTLQQTTSPHPETGFNSTKHKPQANTSNFARRKTDVNPKEDLLTTHDKLEPAGNKPIIETLQAPEPPVPDEQQKTVENADPFTEENLQEQLEQDRQTIETQVNELIGSSRRVNKIKEWEFIKSMPSMVDLNFSAKASLLVFKSVSQANLVSLQTGDLRVRTPVLRYLNDLFQWEKSWKQLEMTYGDQQTNAVLRYVAAPVKQVNEHRSLHYFSRILAFSVDLILGGICFYIATKQPEASFFANIGIAYFLLAVPLMEASPWQSSIGKKMFQLTVVNNSGLRLPWYHSFIRSYCTYLCLAGFKITVWINIFTANRYNALLQDIITKSYVVSRE